MARREVTVQAPVFPGPTLPHKQAAQSTATAQTTSAPTGAAAVFTPPVPDTVPHATPAETITPVTNNKTFSPLDLGDM